MNASQSNPSVQPAEGSSGKKVRKPYTITKSRESWTEEEHDKFLEALQLFDRDWKKIEDFVGSKTVIQIRSHAQKYFLKVQKNGTAAHVPPPRPKRKAAHPYPQKAPKNVSVPAQAGTEYSSSFNSIAPGYPAWDDASLLMNTSTSTVMPSQDDYNLSIPEADVGSKGFPRISSNAVIRTGISSRLQQASELPKQGKGSVLHGLPDFAEVYSFIGSVFDPETKGHAQKLKEMDPINFETGMMGSNAVEMPAIDPNIIKRGGVLNRQQEQEVTGQEIKNALWSMDLDKAPGPDGMTAGFYQAAWPIISQDIITAVQSTLHSGTMLRAINVTSVTLVPKKQQPKYVSDYRPIACCNIIYKIISKVLVNRLCKILPDIVSLEQSAFVKGRKIGDNIILAHEIIKHYGRKNLSPRCFIKVDLSKAYDSIEWIFLEQMLYALNFPGKFVEWILMSVKTTSYSIILNGQNLQPFPAKRGIRQGDPLSPYLFVLVMEYLSRCLKGLEKEPDFNYHPKCGKLNITHCLFADDLLLFSRGDLMSVQLLMNQFNKFSICSGLKANPTKSEIYFGGVRPEHKQLILDWLQMPEGTLPFRYLGVPLSSCKLQIKHYEGLIQKVLGRVTSWTAKKLSYAGRLLLIKSVVLSLQQHWVQFFSIPNAVLEHIDQICRRFLWTGDPSTGRKALVAWQEICLPLKQGGLGVINLKTWNTAALGKLLWDIHHNQEKLWIKWIHVYYCKQQDMWNAPIPQQASWLVRKLLENRNVIPQE